MEPQMASTNGETAAELARYHKRLGELYALEVEEGRALALTPAHVVALEDLGFIVDPFTGDIEDDPQAVEEAAGQL